MEKVAVVTGTSSGIGFETSLALAREGYFTYATMRDTTKSNKIKEIAQKEKLKINVKSAIAQTLDQKQRVDVLVNNAGWGLWGCVEDYYDFTYAWMSEILRILKKSGSMYVFSGWNNLKDVLTALDDIGFTTVNHIIWKYQFGVVTTKKFVTSHYHCLYVCKDNKKRKFFPYSRFEKNAKTSDGRSLHYKDKEDVWNIKREYWTGDDKTPTKLPAEIIQKIIQYSSEKKDLVFDPFLGSGQVAVVSKMIGRRYLGFEIVKAYFNFANKRLVKNIYRLKKDLEN